jgi:subtilisin family serine protease
VASEAPVEVDQSDVDRVCARIIAANRGVPLECHANGVVRVLKTPNDPDVGSLYGLTRLDAPSAWEFTTGSHNVVVAVVDTGVNYNHPDLSANILTNSGEIPGNGLDDDANGYVDDYLGYDFAAGDGDPNDEFSHGSHCAGIIGGVGDNGIGVVGINWSVGILPVRVLDADGIGTEGGVASGILYAASRGAHVISLSLGGSGASATIDSAISYAAAHGSLVVAAAGNSASDNDADPFFPAGSTLDNVIAVAATDSSDGLAYFSNYGLTSVDVAAPGVSILSTVLGTSYSFYSGTSMATPYVSGLAALVKAANPGLGYADLRSLIFSTVDPQPDLQGKIVTGGRVNANAAVAMSVGATPVPTQTPNPSQANPGTSNTLSIRSRRVGRSVYVYGYVKDPEGEAIKSERVRLICSNKSHRFINTDSDGYYAFRFARPRQPTTCYAIDRDKNRSRSVRVSP